jgi:hypothetical protein
MEIETLFRMSLELSLGIMMKLFCDNGRVHWRDFVNDFLFWVPGVQSFDATGLDRQVAAANPQPAVAGAESTVSVAA